MGIDAISVAGMRELDRVAIEDFHLPLEMMMENAGRALALFASKEAGAKRVLVVAGAGANGGGGLAAARHLHNWEVAANVLLLKPPEAYGGVPAQQLRILQDAGVDIAMAPEGGELPAADVVLDAMVGYGLKGDLRGTAAAVANRLNATGIPVLSLDIPSGLDGDTGVAGDPCVRARWTLTLALPKTGLLEPAAADYAGDLYVADIAISPAMYRAVGVEPPPFRGAPYLPV